MDEEGEKTENPGDFVTAIRLQSWKQVKIVFVIVAFARFCLEIILISSNKFML